MSHQVALSFEDGVTRFITCKEDQTVADASYRARINIPVDCRDGACGTCKSFCESGEYDGGFYIEDALTDDEAEQGYCLTCQMMPKSDLVLQIASTSLVAKTQAATFDATITELERLSPTTFAITLDVADRDKLNYLPGQYVNIAVPGTDVARSYSFSTQPESAQVSFLVKYTEGGAMSTYLDERAAVGDKVKITGPNGSFFLREAERPALLLAGGTGLAPILAILRTLHEQNSERKIHLVYGATTDEDVVQLDTLEELADAMPNVTWDYCVADPDTKAPNQGYVTALIDEEHLNDGDVAIYLCGPPAMVEAVRTHFTDNGIEPNGFYYEKFALAATGEEAETTPTGAPEEETDAETPPTSTPGEEATTEEPRRPDEEDEEAQEEAEAPVVTRLVGKGGEILVANPGARTIGGQRIFGERETAELAGGSSPASESSPAVGASRRIGGQEIFATHGEGDADGAPLGDADEVVVENPSARLIGGQEMFGTREIEPQFERPEPEPAAEPAAAAQPTAAGREDTGTGGYVIGEDHPSITESDSLFEAREALELGALALTIGRLTDGQITTYRLLAEATVPYVEGDRFVDAAAYTETNALFHDYLFSLTGNEHLSQAYERLGVKGHMEETLKGATWCHPLCAQDHLDIVDAFEAGDRTRAHTLIVEHAERSKETTRRAMRDADESRRPAWVSPGRFADQVVLVTGAAQGIGERVARRIGAEGGTVLLADRSEVVGEVARDIGEVGPGTASFVTADLETYEGAEAVVDKVIAEHGRIDVAIHNVGGAISFKPFQEFTPEQIDAEIARSLMTTLYGCRAVLPHLIEAGGGTIVNVSSIATGGIHRVPYAAAKGGVNAITRALAVEAAEHGVRVVATAPGGTEAPPRKIERGPAPEGEQEETWFQAHIDQTLDSALLHRYGSLDEQAAAICFVASREAGYITGSVLPVGGGDLG